MSLADGCGESDFIITMKLLENDIVIYINSLVFYMNFSTFKS